MRKIAKLFLLLVLGGATSTTWAALNVFACEPEWGALVTELAGDRTKVFNATTALQDVHRVEPRPSLIAAMRRADFVICTGASLEVGWLPLLLAQSGNARVQPGQPEYFEASSVVSKLEVPAVLDRSLGDLHPEGIPHVQLDPRNISVIANAVARRLALIDSGGAAIYDQRLADFLSRWEPARLHWEKQALPLKGLRVIQREKDFVYLFAWLGIEQAGMLEPKPGVGPSISHLADLLERQRAQPADLIVHAPYQDARASEWLAERTKIPARVLATTVGGTPGAKDLFGVFDDAVGRLLTATGRR